MNICFFSPYVPKHVGGGEKYFFDAARLAAAAGHQVYVAIPGPEVANAFTQVADHEQIRKKYENFLEKNLAKVFFISTPIGTQASFWKKLAWTRQFDCLYYATDGSLFFSLAKKNVLHIQVPFTDAKSSIIDRLKLFNWSVKNTNSQFTKKVIEKHWRTPVQYVHFPMIEGTSFPMNHLAQKEKIILNVGRFFRQLHSKRQDILVKAFQELVNTYSSKVGGWKLVLIGSVEDKSYAEEIAQLAKGYHIEIIHDINREELAKWYTRASIYWHATGYGVDESQEPAKVEHFGISTGEAMLHGCVPVVVGKGGQREVLGSQLKDLLWYDIGECVETTANLIQNEEVRYAKAAIAVNQVHQFSEQQFTATLLKMIQ